MRVVGGRAEGIPLKAPRGRAVRPTIDRVKESVFSTLGPLEGMVVADLFSGTGALGLEALSRGAAEVLFVENDRTALRFLRENVTRVEKALSGAAGTTTILRTSVARVPVAAQAWQQRIDLVLADPPYEPGPHGYGAHALLNDADVARWAGEALLVLEHGADTVVPWAPMGQWRLLKQKRFGSVVIAFAKRATEQDEPSS